MLALQEWSLVDDVVSVEVPISRRFSSTVCTQIAELHKLDVAARNSLRWSSPRASKQKDEGVVEQSLLYQMRELSDPKRMESGIVFFIVVITGNVTSLAEGGS